MATQTSKNGYTAIPMENLMAKATKVSGANQKRRDVIYESVFLNAVSKNDLNKCKSLLEDDECLEEYYFHPLLLAAKKGYSGILELLLEKGVDINVRNKNNCTALHYAIEQRSLTCCKILLERGINIHIQDKSGNLPLHIAASEGILEVVEFLLENNSPPNAVNKKNQTPLHLACKKGNDQVVTLLFDKGGRLDLQDSNSFTPIHYAAFHGQYRCCEILIYKSRKLLGVMNNEKATPLILAAKKGHSRCCQVLRDSDINASNSKGNTALHLAVSIGFKKTVEALLEMRPNMLARNSTGNTPLHKAAMLQDGECLKLLIEKYPDQDPGLNFENQNLVHIAASNDSLENLEFLLTIPLFKDQINYQDKNGRTPLHLALIQNQSNIPELLISNESDCSIGDKELNLPLHIAAENGNLGFIKILLAGKRGQTVNMRNIKGNTPLHLAARKGSLECCKFLMTKGADLSTTDSDGFSPFHIASQFGNLDIVKFLTRKGGGFINQASEVSGDMPLHLVTRHGSYECCEYILKSMKKDLILKRNNKENTALDEAFEDENDKIFKLILSRIPIPGAKQQHIEQYYPLESSLHQFMHQAIEYNREIIQEAIVGSDWWLSGFSSAFCDMGQCLNLNNFTIKNPLLTEVVYGKCIQMTTESTIYNFQLFEDSYFVPRGSNSNEHLRRLSPFDDEGKLKEEAVRYSHLNNHPLSEASNKAYLNLMEHELTTAFLHYKWHSYAKIILLFWFFCEVFLVLIIGLYLSYAQNYAMLETFNITKNDFCHQNESALEIPRSLAQRMTVASIFFGILFTLVFVAIFAEIFSHYQKKTQLTWRFLVRIGRIFGIITLLMPINGCHYNISIKESWQWQVGIITLLLSWFHMIHSLNEIPVMSIFMPITMQFFIGFLKVLLYILLIVFVFAFIFHLLLGGRAEFANIPISFVKTIVWMLGDLGYNDTFVDSDIMYPLMTNIIFVLLVTCISGFIINLIIAQPTDYADKFRAGAAFYKRATRIDLFLKIDAIFEFLKRKWLQKQGCRYKKKNTEIVKRVKENLPSDIIKTSNEDGQEIRLDENTLKTILMKMEGIEAQLFELKNARLYRS